jgi:hypothetical protein
MPLIMRLRAAKLKARDGAPSGSPETTACQSAYNSYSLKGNFMADSIGYICAVSTLQSLPYQRNIDFVVRKVPLDIEQR